MMGQDSKIFAQKNQGTTKNSKTYQKLYYQLKKALIKLYNSKEDFILNHFTEKASSFL